LEVSIPLNLMKALKGSRCVLFVGAGVSAGPGGLPSGTELVRKLAQDGGLCSCQHLGGTSDCTGIGCCCRWSLQRMAQYFELTYTRQSLVAFLNNAIGGMHEPLPAHKAIARLHTRFSAIVTTNYDKLLEEAFKREINLECASVFEDKHLPYVENRPILIKMHGCISDPDSIVITEDDYTYKSFFARRPLVANKLRGYLADQVVLFLGYSLEDSTFRNLYHDVARSLGQHKIAAFAIQRSPTELETKYWEQHGVRILDCDALTFLQRVETELASDIDDLRVLLENAVSVFHADGSLIGEDDMEALKDRLDVLLARSVLNPDMKEVLARSAMHWYRDPGRWLGLISDTGVLETVAVDLLTSENPQAQENAALLARDLKPESAVAKLLLALESPHPSVRRAASAALASIGNCTVAESLVQLAQDERKALIALGTFSSLPAAIAVPVFQTYFSNATTAERRAILRHFDALISKQEGTRSGEVIVQCAASVALESADGELFGMALQLFEDARLDSAADCLAEFALSDAPRNRRTEAILRLGGLRTLRAIECLEELLSKDEEWLRDSALKALRELLSRRRWTSEDDQVRHMAAKILITSEDRSSGTLTLLRNLTGDSDGQIRSLVLQSLDRFYDSTELPDILEPNLTSEDEGVRKDSLAFLEGICSHDEIFERLYRCLDISKIDILGEAIRELGRYGSAEHRSFFGRIRRQLKKSLVQESSPGIQSHYRNALNVLEEVIAGL
jgi:HEAT repeat protein